MRQGIRLGRVAGIPVGVHWSVLVIVALLVQMLAVSVLPATAPGSAAIVYWAAAVPVAVLFMAALLAHEMGHALVARHYGVRVRAITLWLLGGVSELDGGAPHARGDLLIALAGPVVSFAAGAGFLGFALVAGLLDAGALVVAVLGWLALVNLTLGVFNLLPGIPLDGGRALAAVLWWIRGDRAAAQQLASRAGMVLGTVLIGAGAAELFLLGDLGGLWLVLLGWFLSAAANAESTDVRLRRAVGGTPVAAVMTAPAVTGYAYHSVTDFVAQVAQASTHRSYPVVDLDGRLTGLVSLTQLGRVPAERRAQVRLADVQTPRAQLSPFHPGTSLAEVSAGLLVGGHRLVPVLTDDDRVAGVVCSGDLRRALDLASLGVHPDRITAPARPV